MQRADAARAVVVVEVEVEAAAEREVRAVVAVVVTAAVVAVAVLAVVVVLVVTVLAVAVVRVVSGGARLRLRVGGERDDDGGDDDDDDEGAVDGGGLGAFVLEEKGPESSEENRLADVWPLLALALLLVDGDGAVAVALVTAGADGCAGPIEPGVRSIGAAIDGGGILCVRGQGVRVKMGARELRQFSCITM